MRRLGGSLSPEPISYFLCVRAGGVRERAMVITVCFSGAVMPLIHIHAPIIPQISQAVCVCVRRVSDSRSGPRCYRERERDVTSQPPSHTLYELLVHLVRGAFLFFFRNVE